MAAGSTQSLPTLKQEEDVGLSHAQTTREDSIDNHPTERHKVQTVQDSFLPADELSMLQRTQKIPPSYKNTISTQHAVSNSENIPNMKTKNGSLLDRNVSHVTDEMKQDIEARQRSSAQRVHDILENSTSPSDTEINANEYYTGQQVCVAEGRDTKIIVHPEKMVRATSAALREKIKIESSWPNQPDERPSRTEVRLYDLLSDKRPNHPVSSVPKSFVESQRTSYPYSMKQPSNTNLQTRNIKHPFLSETDAIHNQTGEDKPGGIVEDTKTPYEHTGVGHKIQSQREGRKKRDCIHHIYHDPEKYRKIHEEQDKDQERNDKDETFIGKVIHSLVDALTRKQA